MNALVVADIVTAVLLAGVVWLLWYVVRAVNERREP